MSKFILRFLFLITIIIFLTILYLSYFGIETGKFDSLIKEKANEVNKNIKLEFNKTKIHLSPKELNLLIKLKDPKVIIKNNKIELSKLNLFLSIKSFFGSSFLLDRAEIAFRKNDIKDLTKVTNIFVPKIINKQIDKIFVSGKIEGEFNIPFDESGNIINDYGFSGKILDASINLTNDFLIKKLTTAITHKKEKGANLFNISIIECNLLNFELAESSFNLKRKNNQIETKNVLRTTGDFNFSMLKKISSLFNQNIGFIKDANGKIDLKTNIDFQLSQKYRIKDLKYSIEGKIPYAEIDLKEKKIIKNYFPDYDHKLTVKDSNINIINHIPNNKIELDGLLKINNDFDKFNINQIYNDEVKNFKINGNLDLQNSKVNISKLNYTKKKWGKIQY